MIEYLKIQNHRLHDGYEISRCENVGFMNRFLNFPFVYFFQFCEVSGLYNLIKSWWIMFLREGLNSELR